MKAANLALKFALELGAIAAVASWGAGVSVVVAIAAPVAVIALWGTFAAPKSERRLPTRSRVPFELAVFALATAALVAAGRPVLGAVYGALVVVNAALLYAFDQVEA